MLCKLKVFPCFALVSLCRIVTLFYHITKEAHLILIYYSFIRKVTLLSMYTVILLPLLSSFVMKIKSMFIRVSWTQNACSTLGCNFLIIVESLSVYY